MVVLALSILRTLRVIEARAASSDWSKRMRVDITYHPPFGNRSRMLNATIKNPAGRYINFIAYLQAHKRRDLIDTLFAMAETATPDEYWDQFFAVLDQLFDTDMRDIVEGKRWEEVPIDWQGLK
jgi:hypothetical protein